MSNPSRTLNPPRPALRLSWNFWELLKKDRREDRSASPYPNDSGKRKRGRSVEDDGYHRDDVGAGTSRKVS